MPNETLTRSRPWAASDAGAHDRMLFGIMRQDWRGRPEAALELGRKLAGRGEIAYWVDSSEARAPKNKSADRRTCRRERTRLRSAKLLDGSYRFVCDSRICDRSRDGLRLALARDVTLPPQLAVHVDETSEVREAEIVWRRGSTIGIRLRSAAPENALRPCDRYALREQYYAIPD
jgi:hypothetical protein